LIFFFITAFLLAEVAGDRKLLPVNSAATRLGVSRAKLYQLLKAGDIATVRIGQRRLIPVEEIDAYADSLPRESTLKD
jgi:excisionase family DNA binding protein